jgi:UPF0271 protein
MVTVDLNCDLGESFGNYTLGMDEAVIPFVSSVNIACGFHAADPLVMADTVALAHTAGAEIGAHPGFPDLMGFGRRNMAVSPAEAEAYVLYQLGALQAFCIASGTRLRHIKPHGALYNMAAVDKPLAESICRAAARFDDSITVLGLSGSELLEAARRQGLRAASEVFADRAYEDDGTLRSRKYPDSMITCEDEAVRRVIRMVTGGRVQSVSGKDIPITADSVCVHGDNAQALAFVRKIRGALESAGVRIAAF